MTSTLVAIVVILANFISGHNIDLKQESSLHVGKLRHNALVLFINSLSFVALVAYFGFWQLTAWATLLALSFLIPLTQIPYNGRYNFAFARSWQLYRKIRHWTYGACFVALFAF